MNNAAGIDKLPLNVTSFSEMISQSKIYVDKTDLVGTIALSKGPLFLSRPRRFGKSTLVNTFHELFANGLDKFKGLKIDQQHIWQDHTYQVIHLDLSLFKSISEKDYFSNRLYELLKQQFKGHKHCFTDEYSRTEALSNTLDLYPECSLVLLVDEYDAPLTQVLDNNAEFINRRNELSAFFQTIKSYSSRFRFIFITGVARFSNTSIFSGFNVVTDLSFDPVYGAIVGYTQEELEFYFKSYIEQAAAALNAEHGKKDEYDYASVLQKLKEHYDGYCFDIKHRWQIYNPWSILSFLNRPYLDFHNFWLESGGGTPSLLVKYLQKFIKRSASSEELDDFLNLDFTLYADIDTLSPKITSIDQEDFPIMAILYQTGYLTIKDADGTDFEIGIPNLEVKQAFAEVILQKLTSKDKATLISYRRAVKKAAALRDFELLREKLNQLINEFSYESIARFNEAAFRDLFKVLLLFVGYVPSTEYQSALGRSDLCFSNDDSLFIIELKMASSLQQVPDKLNEAKKQIKAKKYGVRLSDKEVVLLAVVIANTDAVSSNGKPLREIAAIERVQPD